MTIRYEVRSACLTGFTEEVERLGGDLDALLRKAGLTFEQYRDGETLIALNSVIRLLTQTSEALRCPDLGMRVAEHQGISMLGLLGKLIASEPDLGSAFKTARRYMTLHITTEHWRMQRHGGLAYIRRIEHYYGETQAQQYRELALRTYVHLVSEIGGSAARPRRVEMSHSPISAPRIYEQHFGCPVLFDQEHDCIVYDAKLLTQRVLPITAAAEGRIDEFLQRHLASLEDSLELQVRSLIIQTLGSHQHSLENVAALLGMHPRTLQRRLSSEGLRFKELLSEVKLKTACWHLQASTIDITRLSDALGYQSVAAFSKAFRAQFNASPTQWRKANGQHNLPSNVLHAVR
ncbi:AraC family transcriptional regulator ligand-binding domain-containing protein [Pseudomonas guguanensis]|uniref:AraC family transcriptional regulator n=1 Tax=Ectopseudomonas guguanensis TaxID=1198456 RepID=UPI0032638409